MHRIYEDIWYDHLQTIVKKILGKSQIIDDGMNTVLNNFDRNISIFVQIIVQYCIVQNTHTNTQSPNCASYMVKQTSWYSTSSIYPQIESLACVCHNRTLTCRNNNNCINKDGRIGCSLVYNVMFAHTFFIGSKTTHLRRYARYRRHWRRGRRHTDRRRTTSSERGYRATKTDRE